MSNSITYQYTSPSGLRKEKSGEALHLAKYSEIEKSEAPCFFWGRLTEPYLTARCLITLSNIVKSSFSMSPFQLALLKDPIVTAGNEKIRFEGFSHCAGVYARVDVLPDGHDGEFPESGTTNVDFNQPMINALGGLKKGAPVVLSVGEKEVGLHQGGDKVIERKVPLPTKWIKGLNTVQFFLADSEPAFIFNRVQALQLFKTLPSGKTKTDYYLTVRGNRPVVSPVPSQNGVCIGGIHRLQLLKPLIPHVDQIQIFRHKDQQSNTWELYFGPVRFTFSLSRDSWRGFSGEGAGLEALIEDTPESLIRQFNHFSYANQAFNPTLQALEWGVDVQKIDNLAGRLSAMGLLGYDLDENGFFYRRLPFKMNRILSLNPRMKAAEKLLAEDKVEIMHHTPEKTEARVVGTGVYHTVLIEGAQSRCTCKWFSKHQGERGLCKHQLAVRKKIAE